MRSWPPAKRARWTLRGSSKPEPAPDQPTSRSRIWIPPSHTCQNGRNRTERAHTDTVQSRDRKGQTAPKEIRLRANPRHQRGKNIKGQTCTWTLQCIIAVTSPTEPIRTECKGIWTNLIPLRYPLAAHSLPRGNVWSVCGWVVSHYRCDARI